MEEARRAEAPVVAVAGVVRAAGGVVWRRGRDGGIEVVIVHRPAYDDWSLPKGKVQPGEDEQEAALREVEEETSLHCMLGSDLGTTSYVDHHGRDKTVRYWEMEPGEGALKPANEVDDARWVRLEDAPRRLSYDHDRRIVERLRSALTD